MISSPVDGFIGKRYLDPGAAVSPNAPVASVVDIRTVRMVANVVEKDVKRLNVGMPAQVEVDAFPGEKFVGRVSRIAPVFDPQTRTAEMEIEVPNQSYRLKPGMYARVELTIDSRAERADRAAQRRSWSSRARPASSSRSGPAPASNRGSSRRRGAPALDGAVRAGRRRHP